MPNTRFAFPLLALLGLAAPAFAQTGPQKLADVDASRLNSFQILIEFDYEGGACETTDAAEIGDLVDGTLSVTVPVLATSEVCTMQAKKNEVKQAISAADDVTRIDLTLTGPDGQVIGEGSANVERD